MRTIRAGILMLLAAGTVQPAAAEVLVLHGGGRIAGELLNRDEVPRQSYMLKTATGRITLTAAQVDEVLNPSPAQLEFENIRPRYPDTAKGQWDLATWCGEHGLAAERRAQLARVIELDPEHLEARRLLGYFKRDGKWTTTDDRNRADGLVRYQDRWITPQEKELAEKKHNDELKQKEWTQRIHLWQSWLGGNRDAQARQELQHIGPGDLMAGPGLTKALKAERRPAVKLLLVDALSRLNCPASRGVLAAEVLEDPYEEVRLSCLDELKHTPSPEVVKYFIDHLHDKKDNEVVNRAGEALGQLGDRSAILPLIHALITEHTVTVGSAGNPDAMPMSMSFGKGGSGGGMPGYSFGGGGPKTHKTAVRNQRVLDSLIALTGANYGYDVNQWTAWYNAQKGVTTIDARRGK